MPYNLLSNDPRLNNPLFRDENGNIPVIKSLNRLGNIVYQIPNDNAQIVYRILVYEASDKNEIVYNNIVACPNEYRLRLNSQVRMERMTMTDYNQPYNNNGERPRRLTGLKFLVDVPTRGSWGSVRTASVAHGTITLNSMNRAIREVTSILDSHISHETERQARERIQREENERLSIQASTFIRSVLELYPLNPTDSWSWRNNWTQFSVTILLDKYQVGKVLDAIHNVRNLQTNPLDKEYLLKKDY